MGFGGGSRNINCMGFNTDGLNLCSFDRGALFTAIIFSIGSVSGITPISAAISLIIRMLHISRMGPSARVASNSGRIVLISGRMIGGTPITTTMGGSLSARLAPSACTRPAATRPSATRSSARTAGTARRARRSAGSAVTPMASRSTASMARPMAGGVDSVSSAPSASSGNGGGGTGTTIRANRTPLTIMVLALLVNSAYMVFILHGGRRVLWQLVGAGGWRN